MNFVKGMKNLFDLIIPLNIHHNPQGHRGTNHRIHVVAAVVGEHLAEEGHEEEVEDDGVAHAGAEADEGVED